MSNLIPPLLSSTPPPILSNGDDEEEDEFGDFRAATNSFSFDDLSPPSSPQKILPPIDINSNNSGDKGDEHFNDTSNVQNGDLSPNDNTDDESTNVSLPELVEPKLEFSSDSSKICETPALVEETIIVQSSDNCIDQKSLELSSVESVVEDDQNSDCIDDDFGDFETHFEADVTENDEVETKLEEEVEKSPTAILTDVNKTSEDEAIEESRSTELCERLELSPTPSIEHKTSEGSKNDHFGEFTEPSNKKDKDCSDSQSQVDEDDDFGEFGEFETPQPTCTNQNDDSDEFGDFTAHGTEFIDSTPFALNLTSDTTKTESILKNLFPSCEDGESDGLRPSREESFDFTTQRSSIFNELKDVTETKAVNYQWSKSESQKKFLKALNIDMRNILYGPSWNSSMPRFAANLTPLEPVRSDAILMPTPAPSCQPPQPSSPSKSSQFTIATSKTSEQASTKAQKVDLPQFDWGDSCLVNPLDQSQMMLLDLEQLILDSTIIPPPPTFTPLNTIETETDDEEWNQWLQQYSAVAESSSPSHLALDFAVIPPNAAKPEPAEKSDYPSSPQLFPLRETHIGYHGDSTINNKNNQVDSDVAVSPMWLKPTILTPDLARKSESVKTVEDDDEFDDFQMVLPETQEVTDTKVPDDEDEFTDFHSSQPPPEVSKPIMEPLKPAILLPQLAPAIAPANNTRINWPEPGVSESDLQGLEFYSRSKSQPQKGPEDDEWSDFVCNPLKAKDGRTATPDLPLSVLNLGQVQAPKQPVPVITPAGLVQTKLSSSNLPQMGALQNTLYGNGVVSPKTGQFSTISEQFSKKAVLSQPGDDDEWSDFVSVQPVQQPQKSQMVMNLHNHYQNQNRAPSVNLIMNPGHFDLTFSGINQRAPAALPDLGFAGSSAGAKTKTSGRTKNK